MKSSASSAYHEISKNLRNSPVSLFKDASEWPKEWTTVSYKSYPRLPKIPLYKKENRIPAKDLGELIKGRESFRSFSSKKRLTKKDMGILLSLSAGIRDVSNGKRMYPSGGGRYPIEIYIVNRAINDLPKGLYHYNVLDHSLDVLWERPFSAEDLSLLVTYPWVREANALIIMTADFSRTQNKYGERGYRYVLIEAGHMGQNILLSAEYLGLKTCSLGGTKDEDIEKLLDIDGVNESIVYGIALGGK